MVKDTPRPAPAKKPAPTQFDRLLRSIEDQATQVTEYGLRAAGQGDPLALRGASPLHFMAEVTGYGHEAARVPPAAIAGGPGISSVRPEVVFQESPEDKAGPWDRLDSATRAAVRVAQDLEDHAGGPVTLHDAWDRDGYHLAVTRHAGLARAWVIPMSLYNTTVTLAGVALARFVLDDGWCAYLVQAEPGYEAVAVVRKAFLEAQCPGLHVPLEARSRLMQVLEHYLALRDRHGLPLGVYMSAPLAVNFGVMLRTLWNFVQDPDAGGFPPLVEVWQKDPESGEWRQELGAPEPETPEEEPPEAPGAGAPGETPGGSGGEAPEDAGGATPEEGGAPEGGDAPPDGGGAGED